MRTGIDVDSRISWGHFGAGLLTAVVHGANTLSASKIFGHRVMPVPFDGLTQPPIGRMSHSTTIHATRTQLE